MVRDGGTAFYDGSASNNPGSLECAEANVQPESSLRSFA